MKGLRRQAAAAWIVGVIAIATYSVVALLIWTGPQRDSVGRAAAFAAVVQTPLVVASLGIAAWQVVLAARASREQAEQAQALEVERSRPYVVVSLDTDREWPFAYLDVLNLGATAAREVRIRIEPLLVTSLTEETSPSNPANAAFLNRPIPVLVPQQRLTTLVEFGPERQRAQGRGVDLANEFTATVEYRSDRGAVYSDAFTLDMEMWRDSTRVDRKGIHELVAEVKKITEQLKKPRTQG